MKFFHCFGAGVVFCCNLHSLTFHHACKFIPPGRPFLQRMIELTRKVNKPHHHIKLSKGFFKDLTMWQQFIHTWNGAGFFLPTSWLDSDSLELHTDASGTLGYGLDIRSEMVSG